MGWGSIGSIFEGAANYLGGILGNEYASGKANDPIEPHPIFFS